KQLEDKTVRRDLAERCHGGMMEAAIGLLQHVFEGVEAGITEEIGPSHLESGVRIVEPGEASDRFGRKTRPRLGYIEAAVAGESGKEHALEGKRRRFTARCDKFQDEPRRGRKWGFAGETRG